MLALTNSVGSSAPTAPIWQATQARGSSVPARKKLLDCFCGLAAVAAAFSGVLSFLWGQSYAKCFSLSQIKHFRAPAARAL
jgi:hypothetical protein